MSVALGAFLAGLLIGESEFRHQIEVDIDPFKGLLLGIFFVTVGMSIDLRVVIEHVGWILLALTALIVVKAAILFGAARLFRVPLSPAAEVALLLSQAGEFAFVVIGIARGHDLLPADLATGAVAVAGLSMMVTPLLARCGAQARGAARARRSRQHHAPDLETARLADHVVIGGYGRVGEMVARILERENVPVVALETDGALVNRQRAAGHPVYFGDASRPELLERAGAPPRARLCDHRQRCQRRRTHGECDPCVPSEGAHLRARQGCRACAPARPSSVRWAPFRKRPKRACSSPAGCWRRST